ncbi:MAG TPA: bacillithiol transferase BstA [Thermoanaerobaculia bacterium]|nr:bacillithiol transferase BstA [Thermoanaerobaculia bacterium]
MSDLAYPIGKFTWSGPGSAPDRARHIAEIAAAPAALRVAVTGLSDSQLETPYRPGGWTVRQVAHHVPDSHLNAYVRFKLAVTEDTPTIKPYDEAAWAELADVKTVPVATSLALLEAVHERWVAFLSSLSESDWKRTFRHPELGVVPLDKNLALYAWHGRHHVAHVTSLRERMGWG